VFFSQIERDDEHQERNMTRRPRVAETVRSIGALGWVKDLNTMVRFAGS
jgi:hypothetical protein